MSLLLPATVFDYVRRSAASLLSTASLDGEYDLPLRSSPRQNFEYLESLLQFGIAPYFSVLTSSATSQSVASTQKKISELTLSFQHLQQTIQIPNLAATAHPAILRAVRENQHLAAFSIDILDEHTKTDSKILNEMQSIANDWMKQVQNVAQLSHEPSDGPTLAEVNFWASKEAALLSIQEQLRSPEIQLTLDVLRSAKRYHATVTFSDTGIKDALNVAAKHNQLLKDLPINDLLSAQSLDKIGEAVSAVFEHLRKLRVTMYPIQRAIKLCQSIVEDIVHKISSVLHDAKVMELTYAAFKLISDQVDGLLGTLEECIKDFTTMARELLRKRSDKFIAVRIAVPNELKEAVSKAAEFRSQHEELREIVSNLVKATKVTEYLDELDYAYSAVETANPLDLGPEGQRAWTQAERTYQKRVNALEDKLIEFLRQTLQAISAPNETFTVFEQYSFLLKRSNIRASIFDHQSELLQVIQDDLASLQQEFKRQRSTQKMLQLRDVPRFSSMIAWISQARYKIEFLAARMELVLTKDWAKYPEGAKIENEMKLLMEKLDLDKCYRDWLSNFNHNFKEMTVKRYIFKIERTESKDFRVKVNLSPADAELFKEVNLLQIMGFEIPRNVASLANILETIYPVATSLNNSVINLESVLQQVDQLGELKVLLQPYLNIIFKGIKFLSQSEWIALENAQVLIDSGLTNLDEVKVCEEAENFQSQIQTLLQKFEFLEFSREQIKAILDDLTTCKYTEEAFRCNIDALQREVNQFALQGFTNIEEFTNAMNVAVEDILFHRCKSELTVWKARLCGMEGDIPDKVHTIVMQDFKIVVRPPLEISKMSIVGDLNKCLSTVTNQQRLISGQFDVSTDQNAHFFSGPQILLQRPYFECIEELEHVVVSAKGLVDKWLQLQSLWSIDFQDLKRAFGTNLSQWRDALLDVKNLKEAFDTVETFTRFGPIKLEYEQAQWKVSNYYNTWQRNISDILTQLVSKEIRCSLEEIKAQRRALESAPVDFGSAKAVIALVDLLYQTKNYVQESSTKIETIDSCNHLLILFRVKFGHDWVHFEQLQKAFLSLSSLVDAKINLVLANMDLVVSTVEREASLLRESIDSLNKQWGNDKPLGKRLEPEVALSSLSGFEKACQRLIKERSKLLNASKVLDLQLLIKDTLSSILGEVEDLRRFWSIINELQVSLTDLRSQEWSSVTITSLRKTLEDVLARSRAQPAAIRQYSAFEEFQAKVKTYIKVLPIIGGLRSDAISDRHWIEIFRDHTLKDPPAKMTLGHVLDLDLVTNEKYFKSAIHKAQGEKNLEKSITAIQKNWEQLSFELFRFNDDFILIKGWDALFQTITEDLNSLWSMKMSPYYSAFEKTVNQLEMKLSDVQTVLDMWIDVQRQWIYLSGVFEKNDEIKKLLPLESTRFYNTSAEFHSLMKKVHKSVLVAEVSNIPNIKQVLTKISETLEKIKKSLIGYLEKQRDIFPRFYFIGNEELLEIVGNSANIPLVSSYLQKMFIGIAGTLYNPELSRIEGIVSPEGEKVNLNSPVSLVAHPSLTDWLRELETETKRTLAHLLQRSLKQLLTVWDSQDQKGSLVQWIDKYPNQVLILSLQVFWTQLVESSAELSICEEKYSEVLSIFAELILHDLSSLQRRKYENLIIELVHQREVLALQEKQNLKSYEWLSQQRYYLIETDNILESVVVKQGNWAAHYGFEYLGAPARLVYTPLMDTCHLAMTEALNEKLGGSLVGPAGTGKTESIKALGQNLGVMVLVFCCDETFDFHSVSRILIGVCRVGSWCCFDEFNRLDRKMLSAISTQIEKIETALEADNGMDIEILGKKFPVAAGSGVFITSNPNYAGRSALPDNLKTKYRTFAVVQPDESMICEVILISQGFSSAKRLGEQVVDFFRRLASSCSDQPHYDFGLRALKSTLARCGGFRRALRDQSVDSEMESRIVVHSLNTVTLPKLLVHDEPFFAEHISIFGCAEGLKTAADELVPHLKEIAAEKGLAASSAWLKKALQVFEIQRSHHGFMMVGDAASGKTLLFECLLEAMKRLTGVENSLYTIDPKVLGKEPLYGSLDYATREWTDGVFTSILRRVELNLRREKSKNIWIVFDGDVDPQWVENLNSVLDDNKMLTLPSGERIPLPENVRIVFEVENLNFATPATVSRCGIVSFGNRLFDLEDYYANLMCSFRNQSLENEDMAGSFRGGSVDDIKQKFVDHVQELLPASVLQQLLLETKKYAHVMDRDLSMIDTFFGLMSQRLEQLAAQAAIVHDDTVPYVARSTLHSLMWSFAGDLTLENRERFCSYVQTLPGLARFSSPDMLYSDISMVDYDWSPCDVEAIDLEPHMITRPDIVIPTLGTRVLENLIFSLVRKHETVILCGPPGSGKTMTLMAALRKSHQYIFVGVNFSKDTTPELVVKALEQHCVYQTSPAGLKLVPAVAEKWVVLFCDEINLPAFDEYGSQTTISFLRQLVERNGFWRKQDGAWVSLGNIQLVGACNPPTDPGRNVLNRRFLRHCSVIMVDYPGTQSLNQIYSTFNKALLKCVPDLRGYVQSLTDSMIQVYTSSKAHFTDRAHYIYSPRELTRWVRGIYEAVRSSPQLSLEGFLRIWAHEALRLFSDRLISQEERNWTYEMIKSTLTKNFPCIDAESALQTPILYSGWLSYDYSPVSEKELGAFVEQRLKVFSEEETNVSLVLYPDLLDHVLRIDRVLKNPQGHMILVGPSGSGKTTLTKFVAWINGLWIHQLSVSRNYTLAEFDATLRELLRRAADGEKLCFIIDESAILETAFLERMNTLLANAEVPGLFEGEDYNTLMTVCSQKSQEQGLFLDSDAELYTWFTEQVAKNFHVVFTITDPYSSNAPPLISSPALFNRCVISWMGDWRAESLETVAKGLLAVLPINNSQYHAPSGVDVDGLRDAVVDVLVSIHGGFRNRSPTPNEFFSLVNNFIRSFKQKETELQEHQSHINVGLDRLRETFLEVKKLNESLSVKKIQLDNKNKEARQMLDKMITDQNEAERKQEASIEIHKRFAEQERIISERRNVVLEDLRNVEPLILEAQKGVKNIKKQHLTELRSMNNPPEAVKMTLESVCILLGYDVSTWRDVQLIIRRDDFIASIVGFDSEVHLTKELADFMEREFISRPGYNFEAVNRASKACGPLLLWVEAQLRYASVVEKVQPLRNEVQLLENELVDTKAKLIAIDGMINDLQESIEVYKEKYSETIRESEKIKAEMQDVEAKVGRSTLLLESLREEKVRWEASVVAFQGQRECLVGNTLLEAAYMSYLGRYNELERREYLELWKRELAKYAIPFDSTFTYRASSLKPDQEFTWQTNGLPNDELFIENTMIMSADKRFAFLIDPSGLMIDFMGKQYQDLVITSFLDDGYVKLLENCIRFGGSILIRDGEHYDPIISRVIARDVETSGGRSLVKLGSREIDLSPNFQLFVHTKDASARIPLCLEARMNVLNYTFTSSSLVNQALNMTLNSEQPSLQQQLDELSKLNGEYKESLYNLENDLLLSLSDTRVSILENDELVNKLESIKHQAATIKTKLSRSSEVLDQVKQVRDKYLSLGEAFCSIQLLLDRLWKLNRIYQFASLDLVVIFRKMLMQNKGRPVSEMVKAFGKEVYSTLSSSLLQEDRAIFESLLKQYVGDFEHSGEYDISQLLASNKYFILRTSGGFDASSTVYSLARTAQQHVESYSMGSSEGVEVARRLFAAALKKGNWLLIENVHMAPDFIEIIPKLLEGEIHKEFRLFMTSQTDSHIAATVVKMCKQVILESNPGIRTVLQETLVRTNGILNLGKAQHPDHARMYVLLAWFYGILRERLRFVPVGFKENYEFTQSDLSSARNVLDQIISKGISWDMLSNLLGRVVFGGKVTDKEDLKAITDISALLFNSNVLDAQSIAVDGSSVFLPETDSIDDCISWINSLPEIEPISWLGLNTEVERIVEEKQASRISAEILKLK
ncbi:hypothetical protein KL930_001777 [Ogataea haglerorum]|nr:hypothetical protein KL915_001832 [Ogataea haglerorum]KAG7775813.1 hypothetical protein KL922_003878 [Ogataea haglerorum]KAG7780855.1 hypothetical protein KL930_001777 [Ogataea haglerorum]KAG7812787.1 hypothetical protein KL924_001535 [Ogataea haglerorum]